MASSIHSLLARELDCSEEQANRLLQSLVREIKACEPNEKLHLPPIGTFQKQGERLTFTPSDALARGVNQRYEGLETEVVRTAAPEEVGKAPKEAHEPSVENVLDRTRSGSSARSPGTMRSPFPSLLEPPEESSSRTFSIGSIVAVRAIREQDALSSSVWAPRATEPDDKDATSTKKGTDASDSDPSEASRFDGVGGVLGSPSQRPTLHLFVALLAFFGLLSGGWYVLGQQGVVPSPRAAIQSVIGAETNRAPQASQSSAEKPSEDTSTEGGADSKDDPEATVSNGGQWTIIVGSHTDEASAETVAVSFRTRLADRSVPVDVRVTTENETSRYRVAVGQYSSRDAAEQARERLASQLPDAAWLLQQ